MTTRQCIEIASQFYRSQEAMKFLFAEKYEQKVSEYADIIRKFMEAHKCDVIPAVQICIEKIIEKFPHDNGVYVAMLLAAAVEMTEGSLANDENRTDS